MYKQCINNKRQYGSKNSKENYLAQYLQQKLIQKNSVQDKNRSN